MNTEKIAKAFLEETLSSTDVLDPFINDGDKEPSWDGNIYIYSNKNKKKVGVKKVPVQVKGTIKEEHPTDKITFRMGIEHIDNYLRDGGVLLFVVYISNDGKRKTIYYDSLLPMKIRVLKDRHEKTKTIPIECKPFPIDTEKMVSVCLNFYSEMQKQTSFASAELKTLDELEREGILEGLSFSVVAYGSQTKDFKQVLFQDVPYLYAKIKGNAIPQPLQMIPLGLHYGETVNCSISAGEKEFYTTAKRIHSEKGVEFCIGKSFRITAEGTKFSFNYTPTNLLRDALVDTEFMIAFVENGGLCIGDIFLPVDETKNITEDKLDGQRNRLEYCRAVHEILNCLGLEDDVDISQSTDSDFRNTDRLYRGIVKGEPISGLKPDLPPVATIDYYSKKLLVGFNKIAEPGTYNIYDFNSAPLLFAFTQGDEEHFPTSRYEILKPEDYLSVSNIDFSKLIESYQELSDNDYIYEHANLAVLRLLTAYDTSGDSRRDLLQCAFDLANWIAEEAPSDEALAIPVRKINLWQIKRRMGTLSSEEQKEAYQIAEDPLQPESIRVGAHLILSNQIAAESHFANLPEEEKNALKEFPIFRYWQA